MSDELQLPRAARVFVSFVALLRVNGFAVAPEQTTAFLAAIELLGPRSLEAIRQAGLATLASPPERRAPYDRLFDIHFIGSEAIDRAGAEDEEVVRLQEEGRGEDETLLADEANESGWHHQHDDNQQEAVDGWGELGVDAGEHDREPLGDCRSDQRAEDRGRASDDHGREELDRTGEGYVRRLGRDDPLR